MARETAPLAKRAAEDGGGGFLLISCADMSRFYFVEFLVPQPDHDQTDLVSLIIIKTVILSKICVCVCVVLCTEKQGHPKWVVGQMGKRQSKDYVGLNARPSKNQTLSPMYNSCFPIIT